VNFARPASKLIGHAESGTLTRYLGFQSSRARRCRCIISGQETTREQVVFIEERVGDIPGNPLVSGNEQTAKRAGIQADCKPLCSQIL